MTLLFECRAKCNRCGGESVAVLTPEAARAYRFRCPACGVVATDDEAARTLADVTPFFDAALAGAGGPPAPPAAATVAVKLTPAFAGLAGATPEDVTRSLLARFLDDNPAHRPAAEPAPGGTRLEAPALLAFLDWLVRNRLADPHRAREVRRRVAAISWPASPPAEPPAEPPPGDRR